MRWWIGLLRASCSVRNVFPDVVYFPEGPGGDPFEEKIFVGPFSRITRDALSFIERNYLNRVSLP